MTDICFSVNNVQMKIHLLEAKSSAFDTMRYQHLLLTMFILCARERRNEIQPQGVTFRIGSRSELNPVS